MAGEAATTEGERPADRTRQSRTSNLRNVRRCQSKSGGDSRMLDKYMGETMADLPRPRTASSPYYVKGAWCDLRQPQVPVSPKKEASLVKSSTGDGGKSPISRQRHMSAEGNKLERRCAKERVCGEAIKKPSPFPMCPNDVIACQKNKEDDSAPRIRTVACSSGKNSSHVVVKGSSCVSEEEGSKTPPSGTSSSGGGATGLAGRMCHHLNSLFSAGKRVLSGRESQWTSSVDDSWDEKESRRNSSCKNLKDSQSDVNSGTSTEHVVTGRRHYAKTMDRQPSTKSPALPPQSPPSNQYGSSCGVASSAAKLQSSGIAAGKGEAGDGRPGKGTAVHAGESSSDTPGTIGCVGGFRRSPQRRRRPLSRVGGGSQRATPSRDRTTPSRDRATPSHDQPTPSRDRTTPSRDRATPSRDRATPSRDRATPSRDRATPSRDRARRRPSKARGGDNTTVATDRVVPTQGSAHHPLLISDRKHSSLSSTEKARLRRLSTTALHGDLDVTANENRRLRVNSSISKDEERVVGKHLDSTTSPVTSYKRSKKSNLEIPPSPSNKPSFTPNDVLKLIPKTHKVDKTTSHTPNGNAKKTAETQGTSSPNSMHTSTATSLSSSAPTCIPRRISPNEVPNAPLVCRDYLNGPIGRCETNDACSQGGENMDPRIKGRDEDDGNGRQECFQLSEDRRDTIDVFSQGLRLIKPRRSKQEQNLQVSVHRRETKENFCPDKESTLGQLTSKLPIEDTASKDKQPIKNFASQRENNFNGQFIVRSSLQARSQSIESVNHYLSRSSCINSTSLCQSNAKKSCTSLQSGYQIESPHSRMISFVECSEISTENHQSNGIVNKNRGPKLVLSDYPSSIKPKISSFPQSLKEPSATTVDINSYRDVPTHERQTKDSITNTFQHMNSNYQQHSLSCSDNQQFYTLRKRECANSNCAIDRTGALLANPPPKDSFEGTMQISQERAVCERDGKRSIPSKFSQLLSNSTVEEGPGSGRISVSKIDEEHCQLANGCPETCFSKPILVDNWTQMSASGRHEETVRQYQTSLESPVPRGMFRVSHQNMADTEVPSSTSNATAATSHGSTIADLEYECDGKQIASLPVVGGLAPENTTPRSEMPGSVTPTTSKPGVVSPEKFDIDVIRETNGTNQRLFGTVGYETVHQSNNPSDFKLQSGRIDMVCGGTQTVHPSTMHESTHKAEGRALELSGMRFTDSSAYTDAQCIDVSQVARSPEGRCESPLQPIRRVDVSAASCAPYLCVGETLKGYRGAGKMESQPCVEPYEDVKRGLATDLLGNMGTYMQYSDMSQAQPSRRSLMAQEFPGTPQVFLPNRSKTSNASVQSMSVEDWTNTRPMFEPDLMGRRVFGHGPSMHVQDCSVTTESFGPECVVGPLGMGKLVMVQDRATGVIGAISKNGMMDRGVGTTSIGDEEGSPWGQMAWDVQFGAKRLYVEDPQPLHSLYRPTYRMLGTCDGAARETVDYQGSLFTLEGENRPLVANNSYNGRTMHDAVADYRDLGDRTMDGPMISDSMDHEVRCSRNTRHEFYASKDRPETVLQEVNFTRLTGGGCLTPHVQSGIMMYGETFCEAHGCPSEGMRVNKILAPLLLDENGCFGTSGGSTTLGIPSGTKRTIHRIGEGERTTTQSVLGQRTHKGRRQAEVISEILCHEGDPVSLRGNKRKSVTGKTKKKRGKSRKSNHSTRGASSTIYKANCNTAEKASKCSLPVAVASTVAVFNFSDCDTTFLQHLHTADSKLPGSPCEGEGGGSSESGSETTSASI